MIQEIERYLAGEMSSLEAAAFESKRRSHPEIDQEVVAHQLLVKNLEAFGQRKELTGKLNALHAKTDLTGLRAEFAPKPAKIRFLNRKTLVAVAAAACVALVTSLGTIAVMQKAAKKTNEAQYEDVRRKVDNIQRSQNDLIRDIKDKRSAPINPGTYGGTCFAINRYGYMLTNRHVIANADSIYIQNNRGEAFKAISVFEDVSSDLAVIRIVDSSFRTAPLPYSLKPKAARLGEEVFTMGFPRDEVVYGRGYISAQTGFNGDTISYQVSIPVSPGNSGAPLLDGKGQIIGIITGKQRSSDGIAFAIKSANKRLLEEMPKESINQKAKKEIKSNVCALDGLSREDQLKKLEDYVYMVKVYN
ncbi:serine protease [Chitinophaga horti]|uniref:Serine protease n=1 Tax=Chitinophaga horti TaxID=2920382 RepID=A0ABY6J356_9BACT|nr:serine protease [Chitinophaga horti]UYQ93940.1 serine protease [Chitinophaga horti]